MSNTSFRFFIKQQIGNPDCRVVVELENATVSNRLNVCIRRIIVHNDREKNYCVMTYDEANKKLKLVSWHHEGDHYGDGQWSLK